MLRHLDEFLRIEPSHSASDKLHARIVSLICLAFIVSQFANLVFLTMTYGGFTADHAVAAATIIVATVTLVALRSIKNMDVYAFAMSVCIIAAIAASSLPDGTGVNSALLPLLVVGVIANGFLGSVRISIFFFVVSICFIWYLHYVSTNAAVPAGVPISGYEERIFQRAIQASLAVALAAFFTTSYSLQTESEFKKLDRLKDQLMESEQARVDCLANISHEFCTPLNGILGISEILTRRNLPASDKELVELIYKNSEDMSDLVNRIMVFAQSEASEIVLDGEPVNIRKLIQNMAIDYQDQARQSDIALRLFVDQDVPENLEMDTRRFQQMIAPLIDNAIKFSSGGEVSVHLENLNSGKDRMLRIMVKDEGIGVEEQFRTEIFERFFQVDNGRKRAFEGLGLGLATARNLADLMGGTAELLHSSNKGSVFSVTIPVTRPNMKRSQVQSDEDRLAKADAA